MGAKWTKEGEARDIQASAFIFLFAELHKGNILLVSHGTIF